MIALCIPRLSVCASVLSHAWSILSYCSLLAAFGFSRCSYRKRVWFCIAVCHSRLNTLCMQVEACRARLYRMELRNMEEDETPAPTAAWRESCKKAIIPEV